MVGRSDAPNADEESAMSVDRGGRPFRRFRRIGWLVAAQVVTAAGVAVLVVVLRSALPDDRGAVTAGLVVLLLFPALLFGASMGVHRGSAAGRELHSPRAVRRLRPACPPIEKIAVDLRRMLRRHDVIARSTDAGARSRLQSLETLISRTAVQAARALGVSHPEPSAYGAIGTLELRQLLRSLMAAGLVLPPGTGLVSPDSGRW
jgi:hypothetical protein